MKWFFAVLFSLGLVVASSAQSLEVKPADSYFEKFKPLRAPAPDLSSWAGVESN